MAASRYATKPLLHCPVVQLKWDLIWQYPSFDLGEEFDASTLGKVASKGNAAFLGATHKYLAEPQVLHHEPISCSQFLNHEPRTCIASTRKDLDRMGTCDVLAAAVRTHERMSVVDEIGFVAQLIQHSIKIMMDAMQDSDFRKIQQGCCRSCGG